MTRPGLLTCVLCGRSGVKDFVVHSRESTSPGPGDEETTWRCGNRDACDRRQQDAAPRPATGPGADTPPSASASVVAGLAREVEALRRAVDPLAGLPGQVDDLAAVVARLAEELAAFTDRPEAAAVPSWLMLPADPETASGVLEGLVAWLGAVFLRYPDAASSLPECWLWHPAVVEELLWLMHAWLAAYQGPHASPMAVGDWHDRYRPGVARRIKETTGRCSLDNHPPRDGHDPGAPVVPLADTALDAITTWWATARDQPAPQPTTADRAAARALEQPRRR